jgi:hypothetical protein
MSYRKFSAYDVDPKVNTQLERGNQAMILKMVPWCLLMSLLLHSTAMSAGFSTMVVGGADPDDDVIYRAKKLCSDSRIVLVAKAKCLARRATYVYAYTDIKARSEFKAVNEFATYCNTMWKALIDTQVESGDAKCGGVAKDSFESYVLVGAKGTRMPWAKYLEKENLEKENSARSGSKIHSKIQELSQQTSETVFAKCNRKCGGDKYVGNVPLISPALVQDCIRKCLKEHRDD